MKRVFYLLFCAVLVLSGCSNGVSESDKIQVVTTIYPLYEWVNAVAGDEVEVTLLIDNGADLHSFQPSVKDLAAVSNADVFVYAGGESDDWVEDALAEAVNENQISLNLMEVLGEAVKEEETVEGMEEEHDHDADEEETEYDEHIWLSLRNAEVCVNAIKDALVSVDSGNAELYTSASEEYVSSLDALDQKYSEMVSDAERNTILVADRFPFRYLTEDYDLEYYAAFSGCSAESDASFETVIFLAGKVDELNLPVVLTIDGSDQKIAETVVSNTETKDQKVLVLDSMQSTMVSDEKSYLSIMEENYEVLKEALN